MKSGSLIGHISDWQSSLKWQRFVFPQMLSMNVKGLITGCNKDQKNRPFKEGEHLIISKFNS